MGRDLCGSNCVYRGVKPLLQGWEQLLGGRPEDSVAQQRDERSVLEIADAAERAQVRAELDAYFFHLYGLSREDADYILETFPIVRKNDEKAHGEYRTKRLILEAYDAMAAAARIGAAYSTRLSPPPADPTVAHPPKEQA